MLSAHLSQASSIVACRACSRGGPRLLPDDPMPNPTARVLVIIEAPVERERWESIILKHGFNPTTLGWVSLIRCADPLQLPPTETELTACRRWTDRDLVAIYPYLILAVGLAPTRYLLGPHIQDVVSNVGWYVLTAPGQRALPWSPLWLKVRGYVRDPTQIAVRPVDTGPAGMWDLREAAQFAGSHGLLDFGGE